MSLFSPVECVCPQCGALDPTALVASVNADRRPDLRAQIIDGTFQTRECALCGTAWRMPPNFTYMHLERDQWIVAEPPESLAQWIEAEERTLEVFNTGYGPTAPSAAREIGATLHPRLVFGWPALREKLLAIDLGLEDVSLELLKIAVLRDVAAPPFADQSELRLDGGDATTLRLAWMDSASEARLATLAVPRDVYDDVAGDAAWDELRADVTAGPFVDINRLLVPVPPAE
jgi:hypothetical protein